MRKPEKETYLMEFICHNCGTRHINMVPWGEEAHHHHKECPYCGNDYWFDFTAKKPEKKKKEKKDNGQDLGSTYAEVQRLDRKLGKGF